MPSKPGYQLVATALALSCQAPFVIQRGDGSGGEAGQGAATSGGVGAAGHATSGGAPGSGGRGDPLGGTDAGGTHGVVDAGGAGGDAGQPLVECQRGFFARHVSAGEYHACATDYVTSALYCWGLGSSGQLGNGATFDSLVPLQVRSTQKFAGVRTGAVSTCAVSHGVDLFCFGDNFDGVLADGTDQGQSLPVLTASSVRSFSMSSSYVVANTTAGLFAWGGNTNGQLGLGDASLGMAVRTESFVGSMEYIDIAAGYSHTCAMDAVTRFLHCAGNNQDSRLGIPGEQRTTFTLVSSTRFQQLSAGYDRTCGITTLGELHCWGRNVPVTFGGQPQVVTAPTKLGSSADWDSVAVGFDHVCATTSEGRLLCAGDNSQGELGTDQGSSATFVEPLPGFRTFNVSAGRDFTCALREPDRAIVCFGSNERGKLGRDSEDEGPGAPALVCLPPL